MTSRTRFAVSEVTKPKWTEYEQKRREGNKRRSDEKQMEGAHVPILLQLNANEMKDIKNKKSAS